MVVLLLVVVLLLLLQRVVPCYKQADGFVNRFPQSSLRVAGRPVVAAALVGL
jgi:hypothetical protein